MTTPHTEHPTSVAELAGGLRIVRVRTLRWPNVWCRTPVVVAELRTGRLGTTPPHSVESIAALLRDMPQLIATNESLEQLYWGDVVARLARELQRMGGAAVNHAQAVHCSDERRCTVVVEYEEEDHGLDAVEYAARIIRDTLRGTDPEMESVVQELTRRYNRSRPGPTSLVMIEAARRRGIPVRRDPDESIVQIGLGATLHRMRATATDLTNVLATDVTSDKDRTKRTLERVGIATPGGNIARTLEGALEIAEELGFPVLLKPLDANNGRGISGKLDTLDEVRAAFPVAAAEHPIVVIERFAEGRDHRVVVVNGKVVAVVERVPAHVVGDGRRTIRELAEEINKDPNRSKSNPSASLAPLPLDERTETFLARSGRTLDTVPADGEVVNLRSTANISTGGTAIDRTEEIHPDNAALCELAAGAVGLDIAGLDVLTPDIAVPFRENRAVVIEVNASPGIRMHTHPDAGKPRDVPGAIMDMLFPPGRPTSIPVVAVSGGREATEASRLIGRMFERTGRHVGLANARGVFFDDRMLIRGDMRSDRAINIILSHNQVGAAVLEVCDSDIRDHGLGFEECDVAIITGASDCIEDGAHYSAHAVITASVRPQGFAILNADEADTLALAQHTPATVVLVSAVSENEATNQHLINGGIVVRVEDDSIVVRDGPQVARRHVLGQINTLLSSGRNGTSGSVHALLAVAACGYVQGMALATIRSCLEE
jgi:cyanophycin synthetase